MRTITSKGTGIAGNVTSTIRLGEDEVRMMLYGQVILTTDATVANRRVVLKIIDESSGVIFDSHSGAVVPASQADQHHEFMQGIFRETSFIGDALQVPIPMKALIPPGYGIQMVVENGQAGDSYSFAGIFEQWQVAEGSVKVEP